MQATEGAVVETAPPPAAPAAEAGDAPDLAFQSTVLTLLERLTGDLDTLKARVETIEDGRPRFVQQIPEELTAVEDISQQHLKTMQEAPADGKARASKIPVFSDGLEVHELVMAQYQPQFRDGQRVRLNLDVVPHGGTDGKTRRELKLDDGTPDGLGEIISMQFLSKQRGHGWKYKVKFPSKALPGSNGGVSSFYEWELVSA